MLTTQEALVSLATTCAGAAVDALREVVGDQVGAGPVSVAAPGRDPLESIEAPLVIATLPAADPSLGSVVFVLPLSAARQLVGDGTDGEPTDEEIMPLREPLGAALSAAFGTVGSVLAIDIALDQLDVRLARTERDVKLGFQGSTRATVSVVSLFGEACRLVQLVPPGLSASLTDAFGGEGEAQDAGVRAALGASLREVPMRVWAEVGRARLRTIEVAALTDGALVELDRAADDPVDLYVNGSRIATGRLICIDGQEWAVELVEVFQAAEVATDASAAA
jgi:flagellar motor switch protein FliN/FliY